MCRVDRRVYRRGGRWCMCMCIGRLCCPFPMINADLISDDSAELARFLSSTKEHALPISCHTVWQALSKSIPVGTQERGKESPHDVYSLTSTDLGTANS